MEDFSKNGRKLRPRRATGAIAKAHREEGPAYSTSSNNYRHSNDSRGEGRPQGRSYGEGRSYGASRPRPEGHSYGEGRPRTESRSNNHGEHRSKNSFSDRSRKPAGNNRNQMGRKPAPKKSFAASKASEEGISRMLSRKPILSDMQYSDNDYVKTPIQEEIRLNKFIANSGVCSRREADTLIQAGVVTVNGEVVTELGTKVNVYKDEVKFNGEKLKGEEKVYLVMNKPKGYVTTASDPHAEKTVMELLKGCPFRVFPVGRLDKSTTGVLMFTNDGELAEKLTHPSYDKKKIYQVSLDKPLKQEDYEKALAGVELTDGKMAADELEFIDADDHRKLGIEIHSGKNRIVRRLFEALGYEVKALDRVYFAGLTKKGLKKGAWRKLSEGEVNILKMGAYV
ncbi:MAG: pseudouridine synthase [Bacteroidales bacterium]|nr:rRNA pseudouridine synthase [Bacteroidales bacterium]MDD7608883.1 pseudouridine synthase [Bacteroidales bacterium]MDY5459824.1 pseudouridine synthase [Candidatus Cryptobacteroides sp.]MEE0341044.1 pseudouridine synthase [Bacteroidales bacterium]